MSSLSDTKAHPLSHSNPLLGGSNKNTSRKGWLFTAQQINSKHNHNIGYGCTFYQTRSRKYKFQGAGSRASCDKAIFVVNVYTWDIFEGRAPEIEERIVRRGDNATGRSLSMYPRTQTEASSRPQ